MQHEITPERLLFKLIYHVQRLTNHHIATILPTLTSVDITVAQLPYFMTVGYSGISNHNLLKEIKVTRQGVSKTIKELEKLNLVYTSKSQDDARSIMIYLTEDGIKLYGIILQITGSITKEYISFLGSKKYNLLTDSLTEIIKHYESEAR